MKYRSRKIVMPGHLNGANTLFGGQALAWIDEEAAIFCFCQLKSASIVTKLMSEINFRAPAHSGDLIEIGCELISFGKTSITVRCSMRNKSTHEEIVTVDKIVFVHVDAAGHPTPHNVTQEVTDESEMF